MPSRGSVGASRDWLRHTRRWPCSVKDRCAITALSAKRASALKAAGLEPDVLEAKEGLALINGTHFMAAQAALGLDEIGRLFDSALIAAAMAFDGSLGTHRVLMLGSAEVRCQPGQIEVAANLRSLLEGSTIVESHKEDDPRVQDPYCLRRPGAWARYSTPSLRLEVSSFGNSVQSPTTRWSLTMSPSCAATFMACHWRSPWTRSPSH